VFDSGRDQASGLRGLFEARPLLFLGLGCASGDPRDREGATALAHALQRAGRRPMVIDLLGDDARPSGSGHRGRQAPRGASIARVEAYRLLDPDADSNDLAALARSLREHALQCGSDADIALVIADPLRLADVAAALTDQIVLIAPGDAASLARLYAQLKAVRLAHGTTRFVAAFRDARSRHAVLAAHRRLSETAARFLGAAVEFGGVLPTGDHDLGAWDRLAASAIDWARPFDLAHAAAPN
jgi:hypothetical protein